MIISLIAALTTDHVIGINNAIPWYLPIDMRWFKYHTLNKPVIMGRKTFESIGMKPLLNRINIILSSHLADHYKGVIVVNNSERALSLIPDQYNEVMIIGGSMIYNMFLPKSDRLYLTYIHTTNYIQGDTWFPVYDIKEWKIVFDVFYRFNYNCKYNLNFKILERFIV